VPRAVEECLRYHPPFRLGRRKAVADIEAFGLALKAGQTVLIPTGGANRDPDRWTDPDRFDVMRTERRHFSFGFGAHFCLGNAIARTNLQEALAILLQRVGRLELAAEPQRVPFTIDEQLDGLRLRLGRIASGHAGAATA
jgi:cytochrome P450